MAKAKKGDKVKVHYTGRLDDGTVFDTSTGQDPMEFEIGVGHVIPGFENLVTELSPGESKSGKVPAQEAYGPHRDELVLEVEKEKIPDDLDLEVGQQLQMRDNQGQTVQVEVVGISASSVKLDANHPLAGKDLTFEVELVEIS